MIRYTVLKTSSAAKLGCVAALFVVIGCSDDVYRSKFSDAERDEIGDIAGDVSYDTVTEHEKIKELEARIEQLEIQR